jgi:DNA-binding Xre family transcriptional regulator
MNRKHIGSDFDDFLEEEGILKETTVTALKRVLVYALEEKRLKKRLTKTQLAEELSTSRAELTRIYNPEIPVSLNTVEKVAKYLGKRIKVELI